MPRSHEKPEDPHMRIAIIHDWLDVYGGAERVLEQIIACYPQADIYSIVDFLPEDQRIFLGGRKVHPTFIQRMPFAKSAFRHYLPLMPLAIEQLDLTAYDLVLSSSYAFAKGVLTGVGQTHVSYVHTPIRYASEFQHQYLRMNDVETGIKSWIIRLTLHYLRMWDQRTVHGVDAMIANSNYIAHRIQKTYGRKVPVLYPPVDIDRFLPYKEKEDFYMTASRLVPYKRFDLVVEAFNRMPQHKLVIIGDGPEMTKLRGLARPNVKLLGYQPFDVLLSHMQRARAFVFAAEEDFGIVPVEAQACGTPVIAYGRGGGAETIRGLTSDQPTGVHFFEQSAEAIIAAVGTFEKIRSQISSSECVENAQRFSAANFRAGLKHIVSLTLERERANLSPFNNR